jgi:hypothetical protein
MADVERTGDTSTRWMRWIARVWGTTVVAVALLIFGGYAWSWVTTGQADPYAAEDYPPIENWPPRLMFLSALGLAVAWRWEGLGGGLALLFQLINLPILLLHWPIAERFPRYLVAPYGLWLVIVLPGLLFLVCWRRANAQPGL